MAVGAQELPISSLIHLSRNKVVCPSSNSSVTNLTSDLHLNKQKTNMEYGKSSHLNLNKTIMDGGMIITIQIYHLRQTIM